MPTLFERAMYDLLRCNPHVIACYYVRQNPSPIVEVVVQRGQILKALSVPAVLTGVLIRVSEGPPLKPLVCGLFEGLAGIPQQVCQNEPIRLGCQIQPQGEAWVGTAGCPVKWSGSDGVARYGVLSNWHVMASVNTPMGKQQHQPDDSYPWMGKVTDWSEVKAGQVNVIDAALADSLREGYHTISREIIDVGQLRGEPVSAVIGAMAIKSGRTTGLTHGRCKAVGASVRVNYGSFTAEFQGQDVYEDVGSPFSAAGDSGSLIVSEGCGCPMSLLFAGGGGLTVGNPMREVVKRFGVAFLF